MKSSSRWINVAPLGLLLLALISLTAKNYSATSLTLVVASVALFLSAGWSAINLLGTHNTRLFAGLGVTLGWFAEQMGSSRGWFFGRYTYTDVLGPRLGDVPLVIALMWFALCFIGYCLANLILWRAPDAANKSLPKTCLTALLAAMLVTAFDLGADPYFVFVLKAWIMQKTDGGWFGETLQGFAGWMLISFVIVLTFQYLRRDAPSNTSQPRLKFIAAIPIALYASGMLFQIAFGHPIETRAVALFAMGIPILAATVAWWQWQKDRQI